MEAQHAQIDAEAALLRGALLQRGGVDEAAEALAVVGIEPPLGKLLDARQQAAGGHFVGRVPIQMQRDHRQIVEVDERDLLVHRVERAQAVVELLLVDQRGDPGQVGHVQQHGADASALRQTLGAQLVIVVVVDGHQPPLAHGARLLQQLLQALGDAA